MANQHAQFVGILPMKPSFSALIIIVFLLAAAASTGCRKNPAKEICGTWQGTTRIEQDFTITIRPDSTIEIVTEEDSVRQIRRGTYTIVDRRLRTILTSRETHVGAVVRREATKDQEEALFTFTGDNEMVLRKGLQAIILERIH